MTQRAEKQWFAFIKPMAQANMPLLRGKHGKRCPERTNASGMRSWQENQDIGGKHE